MTHTLLPTALIRDSPFQRTHANKFSAEGGTAKLGKDKPNALGIVSASYPAHAKSVLTLNSQVSLKNFSVALSRPGKAPQVSKEVARTIYDWVVDNTFRDPKGRAADAETFGSCWSRAIWTGNVRT